MDSPSDALLYETLRVACFHEVVRQAQGKTYGGKLRHQLPLHLWDNC